MVLKKIYDLKIKLGQQRGIGPAYCDKADRTGLRMCDVLENDFLEETWKKLIAKNDELQNLQIKTSQY